MSQRLTKGAVDALTPLALASMRNAKTGKRLTEKTVWCGVLRGFGVRLRQSGEKSFLVMYRIGGRNGTLQRVTIGSTSKLTLTQARDAADAILAQATLRHDVAADRSKLRKEAIVAELCDLYLGDACAHKAASTISTDKSAINLHIKPLLGRKRVSEVTQADVQRFVRDVAARRTARRMTTSKGKTVIVGGGKGAATRTLALLSSIFAFAMKDRLVTSNPCSNVDKFKGIPKERFLSLEELGTLGETLTTAETRGLPAILNQGVKIKHRPKDLEGRRIIMSPHVAAAFRLLLFTGCRLREVLHLRWDACDFERGVIRLRKTKTGPGKTVPMNAPVRAILASLPRVEGCPFVIAGATKDKPRADLQAPWKSIKAHAGLENVRIHDLRHTHASVGVSGGTALAIVGKLLNHSSPTMTARYAHFADEPVRYAADKIASTIAAAMEGKAATVIPIRETI